LIINGVSVTYTASANGLASSDVSFAEAEKVAVIASNSAARLAASATVDKILVQFAHVLSELTIDTMVTNNLTTEINLIFPIELAKIARRAEGNNFILNRSTVIEDDQLLVVPEETFFTIPDGLSLTNKGLLVVGSSNRSNDDTTLKTTPCDCSKGVMAFNTGGTWTNAGVTTVQSQTCMTVGSNVPAINSAAFVNKGCVLVAASVPNSGIAAGTFKNSGNGYITNQGNFRTNVPVDDMPKPTV
jgi:hypothetical protein